MHLLSHLNIMQVVVVSSSKIHKYDWLTIYSFGRRPQTVGSIMYAYCPYFLYANYSKTMTLDSFAWLVKVLASIAFGHTLQAKDVLKWRGQGWAGDDRVHYEQYSMCLKASIPTDCAQANLPTVNHHTWHPLQASLWGLYRPTLCGVNED